MKLPYMIGEASLAHIVEEVARRKPADVKHYQGIKKVALIIGNSMPEIIVDLYCVFKFPPGVSITRFAHDDPRLMTLTKVYQEGRPGVQVVRMLPPDFGNEFARFEHITHVHETIVVRWWGRSHVNDLMEFIPQAAV